ncbi:MAG: VOC family protein [Alphaproteobacteria bacterium]|nr:VOC family protein [Alphaproteobacteria bacterium]
MLDHISLGVKDIERSRQFYDVVLKTLGYERLMNFPNASGYGKPDQPAFWIGEGEQGNMVTVGSGVHIAFIAESRQAVDNFYNEAIKAKAQDNGKPGLRPHYHPNYYGAFVIDLDGHKIEAVCRKPA